jgi:hypothetical protein
MYETNVTNLERGISKRVVRIINSSEYVELEQTDSDSMNTKDCSGVE